MVTQVSFTRLHGGRKLYFLKVQLVITPDHVGLSEGFGVVVALDEAHVGMVKFYVYRGFMSELDVFPNIRNEVFIKTTWARVLEPKKEISSFFSYEHGKWVFFSSIILENVALLY